MRSDWWKAPTMMTPPAPIVHEKDAEPVLYDHRGKPMTKDRRAGFRPPKERRR